MNVLIVGGGIAGASLGIRLRQEGVDVTVAELDPEWSTVGLGILLQGPALRALDHIGVVDELFEVGFPYSQMIVRNGDGNLRATIDLPRVLGPERPAVCGVMRPALQRLLAERVRAVGAEVHLGTTVSSLEHGDGCVRVDLTNGASGDYDVVVGADGAYSRVRSLVFGEEHIPEYQRQRVWRAVLPRPPEATCMNMFYGRKNTTGFNIVSDTWMYVFLVENVSEHERLPDERLPEVMREELAEFGGFIAQLREQITDPAQIVMRPIEAHLVPAPWHRGRVVLIGDAAHSMPPHLASGATIAVEDALVLAALLVERQVEEALAEFSMQRFDRCRTVVENSVQIGRWQREGRAAHDDSIVRLINETNAMLAQPV